MCPNTEFFVVVISLHLDSKRRFTEEIFVIISNAGKYGPEKTWYLDNFHAVVIFKTLSLQSFQTQASLKGDYCIALILRK